MGVYHVGGGVSISCDRPSYRLLTTFFGCEIGHCKVKLWPLRVTVKSE